MRETGSTPYQRLITIATRQVITHQKLQNIIDIKNDRKKSRNYTTYIAHLFNNDLIAYNSWVNSRVAGGGSLITCAAVPSIN